jgi:hypothetical protein
MEVLPGPKIPHLQFHPAISIPFIDSRSENDETLSLL